jgi:transcriptional regulator with XRE-family HTH domain
MEPTYLKSSSNIRSLEQAQSLMARLTEKLSEDLDTKAIAERIVRLRKERGITQIEVSKTLGITQPMVSRLEKGDYRLNGEIIIGLAKLFRITADELLGLKSPSQTQSGISRRWLKRLSMIERLPKRDQDGLIQTVDRYLKASGAI